MNNMFSHDQDLANMMLSSDLLNKACTAICDTPVPVSFDDHDPFSISIYVFETLLDNGKIIAFRSSLDYTVQNLDVEEVKALVPSTGTFFDFIPTKVNPSISINKVAVDVFTSLFQNDLSVLQDKIDISKRLIVTGNSLGGSIASLFTLYLLDTIYTNTTSKRPICITFGSPLLGDIGLQKAIYQRSSWPSCFLHVALSYDPIPKLFVSPNYEPFGSFFFCSESGCACIDQPESVTEVMVALRSVVEDSDLSGIQIMHYRRVLVNLKSNAKYKGMSNLGDSDLEPLRVGIVLQLVAIGVIQTQEENNDINSLIDKIKKTKVSSITRKRNVPDKKRKLNESKISMTYHEWYKKKTVDDGGYYDAYKKPSTADKRKSRDKIKTEKTKLEIYWKNMVDEAKQKPQKEAVSFRTSWLFAATNYRRMVEPLHIADHYLSGKTDYMTARPEHFKMIEKWFNDDKKPENQTNSPGERKKPASLTEDSCFWARVEEAVISFKVLMSSVNDLAVIKQLEDFEDYVIRLFRAYSVSPEIFLPKSTFMVWWEEYKCYKETRGAPYNSLLANFMRTESQQYV